MTSFNLDQPARDLTELIIKGPPLGSVSLAEARKAVEATQSESTRAAISLAVAALRRAFGTD